MRSGYGHGNKESARVKRMTMTKPINNAIQPPLIRILHKVLDIWTNKHNFKKTLKLGNPKLIRFLTESRNLSLNMNKVLGMTKEKVQKTNQKSKSGNDEKNKITGTVIYNRIYKSGSSTLLSMEYFQRRYLYYHFQTSLVGSGFSMISYYLVRAILS